MSWLKGTYVDAMYEFVHIQEENDDIMPVFARLYWDASQQSFFGDNVEQLCRRHCTYITLSDFELENINRPFPIYRTPDEYVLPRTGLDWFYTIVLVTVAVLLITFVVMVANS